MVYLQFLVAQLEPNIALNSRKKHHSLKSILEKAMWFLPTGHKDTKKSPNGDQI